MLQPSLTTTTRQTQTLTPRLQYAVRLLQLSALDYEQEIHDVAGRNPFLEIEEGALPRGLAANDVVVSTTESDGDVTAAGQPESDFAAAHENHESHDASDSHDADDAWERDRWNTSTGENRDGARESSGSALEMVGAGLDLREHLRRQAQLLPLSPRDHALVCTVIESLDDDGYLRLDLSEFESMTDLEPAVEACEVSTALKLVQSFEPAGIGARSVGECLQLQLGAVEPNLRPLAARIVADHIERLSQRDVPGLARLLEQPASEVEAACAALRRLDPRPGWRFARGDTQFVAADVIVRKLRGVWVAQLNGDAVPRVRLNQGCADLFQRHRETRHAEMTAKLQEARWTVRNVEQRFSTILAVAQAILRRQYRFFEHGALAMKPLALRDIAAEVGVHESTVCRVTNNKYMATPAGLLEMKKFFSRPMPVASGGSCSPTAIRGVVQELIDAEDTRSPLSDVDISHQLARQGLKVARRTVTKYRQMLRIPPMDRRRSHAAA